MLFSIKLPSTHTIIRPISTTISQSCDYRSQFNSATQYNQPSFSIWTTCCTKTLMRMRLDGARVPTANRVRTYYFTWDLWSERHKIALTSILIRSIRRSSCAPVAMSTRTRARATQAAASTHLTRKLDSIYLSASHRMGNTISIQFIAIT